MPSGNTSHSSKGQKGLSKSHGQSDKAKSSSSATTTAVPRDQWVQSQAQTQADYSQSSTTERWLYDPSGPYHAIGQVQAAEEHDAADDHGGYATPSTATQGSSKPKTHKSHGHKSSHKGSHKKTSGKK